MAQIVRRAGWSHQADPPNSIETAIWRVAPGPTRHRPLPDYHGLDHILEAYVGADMGATELLRAGWATGPGCCASCIRPTLRSGSGVSTRGRRSPSGPSGRDRRLPITNQWRDPSRRARGRPPPRSAHLTLLTIPRPVHATWIAGALSTSSPHRCRCPSQFALRPAAFEDGLEGDPSRSHHLHVQIAQLWDLLHTDQPRRRHAEACARDPLQQGDQRLPHRQVRHVRHVSFTAAKPAATNSSRERYRR